MTSLTPAIITAISDAFSRGLQVETTLAQLKIPKATFYTWLEDANRDERPNGTSISAEHKASVVALVEAIAHAQAEYEATLVDSVRVAAGKVNAKTGIPEWRAAQFLLTHGPSRSRWYEHRQTHQTIEVQHHPAHTLVRELPTDELLALADGDTDTSENV